MSVTAYIPPERNLTFWRDGEIIENQNLNFDYPKIFLEIGPGNGDFILNECIKNPENHYVAVELKKRRFLKVGHKAKNREIQNLTVVWGDARECVKRLFGPHSLDEIYILFPDPWPKKAHAKHRLIQSHLINFLKNYLKAGGIIHTATDDAAYAEQIREVFSENGHFRKENSASLYSTYFENKWRQEGRELHFYKFILK